MDEDAAGPSSANASAQSSAQASERRPRRLRRAWLVLLFLIAVAIGIAWLQRFAIADNFIRAALVKRGVRASYTIEKIGFRTQRLTNLVIGDPRAPDLTARRIDVIVALVSGGATVKRVEAEGVRLHGRWIDGRLSLGDLDKFSDPTSTSPLALPDIAVRLADAGARIDTPWGDLGLTLSGAGNLKDGFAGQLAAVSRSVAAGGCSVRSPSYYGKIAIADERPRLTGPLRAVAIGCPASGLALGGSAAQLDVTLGAAFDRWAGKAGLALGSARYGAWRAAGTDGTLAFQGNAAATQFDGDVAARALAGPQLAAQRVSFRGSGRAGSTLSLRGRAELAGGSLPPPILAQLASGAALADGSPVEPVVRKLAGAVGSAARQFDAGGDLDLAWGAAPLLRVANLAATARSGARVRLADAVTVTNTGAGWQAALVGSIAIAGGGLPDAVLRLKQLHGGFGGQLLMRRYDAEGGSLAIPELRFTAVNGGARFSGNALLSGPLAGGRVSDLALPIDGTLDPRGRFALWSGCRTLGVGGLMLSGVSLSRQRLTLCPEGAAVVQGGGGGALLIAALLPAIDLQGQVGSAPLSFAAARGRIGDGGRFAFTDARVRLGAGESVTRFDVASLDGAPDAAGFAGTLAGGSGAIANVPLDVGDAGGAWRYSGGALTLVAGLTVTDQAPVDRFRPLRTNDFALGFADDAITATGTLVEPDSGRAVTRVAIVHRLSAGTGHADLAVDALTFDDKFQPTAITPLVLGVVANVEGTVAGTGRIDWSPQGVTSSGAFTTNGTDLAAAFGPVQKLSGTVRFNDLLGLTTAPGQEVRLGSVNPGIAVFDGLLRYQLLPDQRVKVEGGRWPFAGGELVLEPTILDLGQEKPRALTFVVTGLDAAQFLQQFGFDNLQTTGIFDGRLPIIFDADGGHIRGGGLQSREGGGVVAYLGDLSYENLGTFGNYAFQALKSIRYRRLEIGMDGDLGGEIVTQVNFAGLQQGEGASRNFVTKQLAKLPIQFNVTVRAPFLQLVSSVRGYYNPELLVGQNLRALLDAQRVADPKRPAVPQPLAMPPTPPVQPAESEKRP